MNTSLSVCSFARYYMFNTCDQDLTDCERKTATIASIAIGVLTLGLAHLIAFLALYNRDFKLIQGDSRINNLRQSNIPSLKSKGDPLPALPTPPATNILTDKALEKRCNPPSFENAIYQWNVNQIKAWQKLPKNDQMQVMKSRLDRLDPITQNILQATSHGRVVNKVEHLTLLCTDICKVFEKEGYLNSPIPLPGITINDLDALWGVIRDMSKLQKLLNVNLSHFNLPHKWTATDKEFIKKAEVQKLDLCLDSSTELAFAEQYFHEHLQTLNRELDLVNRLKVDDVIERVEELPLSVLTKPFNESVFRAAVMNPSELVELTVDQLLTATNDEIEMISKIFFQNTHTMLLQGKFVSWIPEKSSPEKEIDAIKTDTFPKSRVACLYFLSGAQLEKLLPQISPQLFSFLGYLSIPELSSDTLKTHFDSFFHINKETNLPELSARNRVVRLTPNQIHDLINKLLEKDLHTNLTPQQKKGLDKAKLTSVQCKALKIS